MSIAPDSSRRPSSLQRIALLALAIVAAYLLCEFTLLDRIQVVGRVVDNQTGKAVASKAVLFTLRGDRPYVPVPHSSRRNSVCIRTFVVEADVEGKFYLDELTLNSAFINKEATITAFVPGWMSVPRRVNASSSLLSRPDEMTLRVNRPSSRKLDYHGQLDADPEMLRSEEFASLQQLLAGTMTCSAVGQPIFREIVQRMSEIAHSREERRLTLAYCRRHLGNDGDTALACDETMFSKVDAVTRQDL